MPFHRQLLWSVPSTAGACIGLAYGAREGFNDSRKKDLIDNVFSTVGCAWGGACFGFSCGLLWPITVPIMAARALDGTPIIQGCKKDK